MVAVALALSLELALRAFEGSIDGGTEALTFTGGDESGATSHSHVSFRAALLSVVLEVNVSVGGSSFELGQTMEPLLCMTANGVWNRTMPSGEADLHASLPHFDLARATSFKKPSISSAARSHV